MKMFYSRCFIALALTLFLFNTAFAQQSTGFRLNNVKQTKRQTLKIGGGSEVADGKLPVSKSPGVTPPVDNTDPDKTKPPLIDTTGKVIIKEPGLEYDTSTYVTTTLIHQGHLLRTIALLDDLLDENTDSLKLNAVYNDENLYKKTRAYNDCLLRHARIVEHQADSSFDYYLKEYLAATTFIAAFGSQRSRAFFDLVYENNGKNLNTVNTAGIGFGKNTAAIYTELVSGNLGFLRASIGAMVTGNNNDNIEEAKEEEAYQRLTTYGGNTVMMFEHPLIYAHSLDLNRTAILRAIAKGAADLPAFGTNTDKFAGNASLGLDFYADARTSNGAITLFASINGNFIVGTDTFRSALKLEKKTISMSQITLGVVVADRLRISVNLATFSNDQALRNRNIVAGGQVMR